MKPSPRQAPELRHGPRIVTKEMKEEWEAISEDDAVLLEVEHTYGNGYGVEPYGYQLTFFKSIQVKDEDCEECGNNEFIHVYSSGNATCSPRSARETCNECGNIITDEYWD